MTRSFRTPSWHERLLARMFGKRFKKITDGHRITHWRGSFYLFKVITPEMLIPRMFQWVIEPGEPHKTWARMFAIVLSILTLLMAVYLMCIA